MGCVFSPKTPQGNFGCLNPAFNTSFGTPAGVDGRVHNLWPLNPDGTAPIVNGKELVAAFDRIHTANTIAEGASVCLEPTAGARIECLTEASPCSLGTECRGEPGVFPCSEQGIRAAIAKGGGPHYFDCPGPTTVTTTSGIAINNDVILDGEGHLTVDGHGLWVWANITAELRGFTVSGGTADSGGGIGNSGTLTLTNSTVSGNTARIGGGIINRDMATLTLTGSTVSGNTATNFYGGIANYGTLTLADSTVSGNTATFNGGGIYNVGTLTFTDSTVSDNTAESGVAGGIYNNGTLMLTNSTVSDNTATSAGGIYNLGEGVTLTLMNSTVSGNTATSSAGGIYNYGESTLTNSSVSGNTATSSGGGIDNIGTATLTNSTVSGNTAGTRGGGIANSGTATLTNSTVSDNTADDGGGIANGRTLTLMNSTVSGNTATSSGGGGIDNSGAATLTNSSVSGNNAYSTTGGGIDNRGTLTLTNSTVSGNTAGTRGGGIANSGTATLTNSSVSSNTATMFYGGGIVNFSTATLTLTNSTVSGNAATNQAPGGIKNYGSATLTQSLVDGDCGGPGAITITSGGYNLESPGNTCGFTATGDQHTVPPDGPLGLNLGPLQNSGGPTLTHAPQAPSAAINQIPLAACELTTDQRGEDRPETGGSECDVGAVEVQLP